MKNKGLLTTGLLLGAAAGAVVLLEKNRRKAPTAQLNPAAPVRTTHTIRINAPADQVWQRLSEVGQWTSWQPEIAYARPNGPSANGSTFDWSVSGFLPLHSTITTAEPGEAFGWSATTLGAFSVHNWTFASRDGYTDVTAAETMEGWLVSLLKPLMQPALDRGNARWLEYLREAAEQA